MLTIFTMAYTQAHTASILLGYIKLGRNRELGELVSIITRGSDVSRQDKACKYEYIILASTGRYVRQAKGGIS